MQLALPVWLNEEESFDTFVHENDDVLVPFLKSFVVNGDAKVPTAMPFCVMHSSKSAGKSHLLYSACHYASQHDVSHAYFDMSTIKNFPVSIIQDAEFKGLICIDNIDEIKSDLNWQIALFDLLNRVIEQGQETEKSTPTKVLISAKASPSAIGMSLPDLVSRLNWGTVFKLEDVSEARSRTIIQSRLQAKGLECNDEVLSFLVVRVDRNIKAMVAMVDTLDRRSLQAKRKLTIPFVKEVLDI